MAAEDDSAMAGGASLVYGSMAGGNVIDGPLPFQPPGRPTQQVSDADRRPQPQPVPDPENDRHLAGNGTGRKGGNLHGPGDNGSAAYADAWAQVNSATDEDASGDNPSWTTSRPASDYRHI